MKNYTDDTVWMLEFLAVGVFLSLAAMLAILGGYILVGALVLGTLIALPIVAILTTYRGVARWAQSRARKAVPGEAEGAPLVEMPVIARLVEIEGSCAQDHPYAPGDEFVFEDENTVVPAICGPARHGLLPYVEEFRAGRDGHEARIRCPLSDSVLAFELRREEKAAA